MTDQSIESAVPPDSSGAPPTGSGSHDGVHTEVSADVSPQPMTDVIYQQSSGDPTDAHTEKADEKKAEEQGSAAFFSLT
jgi:hypothetical protein